jgi:hypothetical protein
MSTNQQLGSAHTTMRLMGLPYSLTHTRTWPSGTPDAATAPLLCPDLAVRCGVVSIYRFMPLILFSSQNKAGAHAAREARAENAN